MNNKKTLLYSLIIISLLLSILGCTTNTDTFTSETTTLVPPQEPLEIKLSFPDEAPPLNQTAALNCIIISHETVSKEVSINVNLPDSFELISGSLSWNGSVPEEGIITVINAVVKSVKVGNWTINATGYINWEPDLYGGDFYIRIYVSVNEESAEWGTSPPWFQGITPTEDTENSPPPPTTTIE